MLSCWNDVEERVERFEGGRENGWSCRIEAGTAYLDGVSLLVNT